MTTPIHPSCGKCGYCIFGLQTSICPECGSDLREVGILSDKVPQRKRRLFWILAWTIFLPFPAWLLSEILIHSVLPYSVHPRFNRDILWQDAPNATTFFDATLIGDAWQWGDNPSPSQRITFPLTRMEISVHNSGNPMLVDMKTGGYHYITGGVTVDRQSGFGRQAIKDWLAANGFDFSLTRVQLGAEDLWTLINQTKPRAKLSFHGSPNSGHAVFGTDVHSVPRPRATNTLYGPMLAGFWSLIWFTGVRRISRQRMISQIAPAELPGAGPG